MGDKKKFKETGFGKLLLSKIPSAVGIIGDLLPDRGILGIAKNLISGAISTGKITAEEAAILNAEADRELEYYIVDQKDRESARKREMELAKSDKADWMMYATGIFALVAALAIVVVVLFFDIKSGKELFYFVSGATFAWAGSVVTYYFGSSAGSKKKDNDLKKLLK